MSISAHTEPNGPQAWWEAGHRNRLGSVSPSLQTPPKFLPFGAALSALSFPSPVSPQGVAVEAPTHPGTWAGLPGHLRVPATGQCFPPSSSWTGFSLFPGGSVPSFSLKPWSGPPQVGLARPAGCDPPLVMRLWWVATPPTARNPRPDTFCAGCFLAARGENSTC